MLLSELKQKQVINVLTGCNLGYICDVDIDCISGCINRLFIKKYDGILSLFKKSEKIVICYKNIIKIGEDFIIVKYIEN